MDNLKKNINDLISKDSNQAKQLQIENDAFDEIFETGLLQPYANKKHHLSRLYIIIQKLNYAQKNSQEFDINTIKISDELIYALYGMPRDRIIDYFRVAMHLKGTNDLEIDADIFKKTEILNLANTSLQEIQEEISKCQLLCKECHAKVTKHEHTTGFICEKRKLNKEISTKL